MKKTLTLAAIGLLVVLSAAAKVIVAERYVVCRACHTVLQCSLWVWR